METVAKNLVQVDIRDEMKTSYLDYSMSVIIGRALPDVRDGLKPVHRRILYAMLREGNLASRRYSKCAGVVGEVLKKYHPHGDSAVYDALVRMAQPWNMRAPLVDGQGNFGSVDGDPAAAYRYTESRMTRLAEVLLQDIDKDTVNFGPNFDGSTEEPLVLPAAFPNLLVNGSDGIAVGMATKIPPHNLGETIDACVAMIENPEIELTELLQIIPGPDFPTAGQIYGKSGILQAYSTGRGKLIVRGKADYEEFTTNRWSIVITELPFQVNKARLVQEIARLVKDKKIDGITALRDESDRRGMRIVVELRRDVSKEIILNKLFKHTALQNTFGVNMLAIVNNRPMVLPLKEVLKRYIAHRRDVTMRRCRFELRKALARIHILEGYLIALDNIDRIIELIRSSQDGNEARPKLMREFSLSEIQAQAILDMRLQRLTGLEKKKIEDELSELRVIVDELNAILNSEVRLMEVITEELLAVRKKYANDRRTEIVEGGSDISVLDLIPDEEQVITLSVRGYIKRISPSEFQEQRRGGKGKKGLKARREDSAQDIFFANSHSNLLVFTRKGKAYKLPVYTIPKSKRDSMGTPIVNLVGLEKEDRIAAVLSVPNDAAPADDWQEWDLLFVSRKGQIKRTSMQAFQNVRSNGLIAYACAEGDELLSVIKSTTDQHVLVSSSNGQSIRFSGMEVRQMGRKTKGVRSMKLRENDTIAGVTVVDNDTELLLLTVTSRGYGKRTPLSAYRVQSRGGYGVIDIQTGERNGSVVGTVLVEETDRIMFITESGQVIKIPVLNIREQNRNTKGVRLMRVPEDDKIVGIVKVSALDDEEESENLDEPIINDDVSVSLSEDGQMDVAESSPESDPSVDEDSDS